MHRVRPKGEGKVSKRNQKRSQIRNQHNPSMDDVNDSANAEDIANIDPIPVASDTNKVPLNSISEVKPMQKVEPETKPGPSSITAFRPRTVHRGNQHPKPRLKFK